MNQKRQITLAQMPAGQVGRVVAILGGYGMVARLSALGIRPGKEITKIGSMFRGPVTVQVNQAQVAIGFGMARCIMIELEE